MGSSIKDVRDQKLIFWPPPFMDVWDVSHVDVRKAKYLTFIKYTTFARNTWQGGVWVQTISFWSAVFYGSSTFVHPSHWPDVFDGWPLWLISNHLGLHLRFDLIVASVRIKYVHIITHSSVLHLHCAIFTEQRLQTLVLPLSAARHRARWIPDGWPMTTKIRT